MFYITTDHAWPFLGTETAKCCYWCSLSQLVWAMKHCICFLLKVYGLRLMCLDAVQLNQGCRIISIAPRETVVVIDHYTKDGQCQQMTVYSNYGFHLPFIYLFLAPLCHLFTASIVVRVSQSDAFCHFTHCFLYFVGLSANLGQSLMLHRHGLHSWSPWPSSVSCCCQMQFH